MKGTRKVGRLFCLALIASHPNFYECMVHHITKKTLLSLRNCFYAVLFSLEHPPHKRPFVKAA